MPFHDSEEYKNLRQIFEAVQQKVLREMMNQFVNELTIAMEEWEEKQHQAVRQEVFSWVNKDTCCNQQKYLDS